MTILQWLDLLGWLIYIGGIVLTRQWLKKKVTHFPRFWILVVADSDFWCWTASFLWYLFWPSVIWYRLKEDLE